MNSQTRSDFGIPTAKIAPLLSFVLDFGGKCCDPVVGSLVDEGTKRRLTGSTTGTGHSPVGERKNGG
jgi:hypothetical protein